MNRNTNSHFALNPTNIDIQRATFDRSHSHKTSFNIAELIPIYVDECLPGDTFSMKSSKVVRLQTLVTPMMDNLYLDTYFFFVPRRLVWSHWKQFCGENTATAWLPPTEYSIPQITAPEGGWNVGTIADYMGIPTGVENLSIDVSYFRAYALVCNEWFRSENLTPPLNLLVGDQTTEGSNGGFYVQDVPKGGKPFKVAKYADYFTSCLPSPQKGPDVQIPVATPDPYPVYTRAEQVPSSVWSDAPMHTSFAGTGTSSNWGALYSRESDRKVILARNSGTSLYDGNFPVIDNLWAFPNSSVPAATINQLRLAFQIQRFYEKSARGGSRYIEILKAHFGVTSPDSRLQRPEYLGGNRIPLSVNQVVQQSGTESVGTPQGNVAGFSCTHDTNHDFTHSFTEHGILLGLACVRYDHTYQQGLNRMFSRRDRFDFYWPAFANIGEMAVLNKEIYAQGTDADDEVFGYQEAWADYRYKPSMVTGEMRSTHAQSLDSWHLADYYTSQPYLSDAWLREDKTPVDRVLAVQSSVSNQIFGDWYFKVKCTRPMPLYSIPGLIDHH